MTDKSSDDSNLTLRLFAPSDSDTAADVIHRSTSAAYSFMSWTHSREETRAWFAASVDDWSAIWLAERDGRLVGVLCLNDDHIDQLFVDSGEQRTGIGSRLLAKALELCQGPVTLHTFQMNRTARAFYERHGFQAVAFGVSEAEGEPDVLYRLDAAERSTSEAS